MSASHNGRSGKDRLLPRALWIPSSRSNPCPVCGRTKDGDCRISPHGDRVICHHPKDYRPGEVVSGWAFTGNTDDGRAGHFRIDRPRDETLPTPSKVVPFRSQSKPKPPAITGPISLARRSEQLLPPTASPYHYSQSQRVVRKDKPDGSKTFRTEHHNGTGWQPKAGPDPWPLWGEAEALTAKGWILEAEGEKCVGLAMTVRRRLGRRVRATT